MWDSGTGQQLALLTGHDDAVRSASWDATARVWDAISGKEMAVVSGYFDAVRNAIWSSDGAQFMTTSWGGPVRVFAVPIGNSPDTACANAIRNLTNEEWEAQFDPSLLLNPPSYVIPPSNVWNIRQVKKMGQPQQLEY